MVYIITGAFILLDFITGIVKAFKNKCFTSTIMREGLFHKAGSVVVVAFGALVDFAQGYMDLGVTIPIAIPICIYICLMECGSIIENVGEINPRIIPTRLRAYFHKLSDQNTAKAEDNTKEKEVDVIDDVHGKEG